MSTTTEFTIVAVIIAALVGAALHLDGVRPWPPVTAGYATAAAAEPATTGSIGH